MRRLLLINPNTTAAMTERMAAAARRLLPEDIEIEARTASFGAPVIASRASYAIAAHAALEAYGAGGAFDAVVIGCFGDPGLEALREAAAAPVFAFAESAIREADVIGAPFAILTLGRAWIAMLEERVLLAGVRAPFVGVFAAEGDGLDASRDAAAVAARLQRLADGAVSAGACTLILGGAALAGFAGRLKSGARILDGLEAAMRQVVAALRSPPPAAPLCSRVS